MGELETGDPPLPPFALLLRASHENCGSVLVVRQTLICQPPSIKQILQISEQVCLRLGMPDSKPNPQRLSLLQDGGILLVLSRPFV